MSWTICVDCKKEFEQVDNEDTCPKCYQEYLETRYPKHPDDKGGK